jgi:competence protein ComEC
VDRLIVWVAAAFAGGIALARATALSAYAWLALGLGAVVAAAAFARAGPLRIGLVLTSVAAAGAVLYATEAYPDPRHPLLAASDHSVTLTGTVVYPPLRQGDRIRLIVRTEKLRISRDPERRAGGRVLVYARGAGEVRYGDRIRIQGLLRRPGLPGNPHEFSPRDHLAAQGIHAVLYARRGSSIRMLGRGRANPVLAAAYGLRDRMAAFFAAALPGERGALLDSLLLGDDGAIPRSLRDAFARAGLLHVLVVSGAQVGLVATGILWLGRTLRAPPAVQHGTAGIAVVFFALMTGWVPSVARAALMSLVGLAAAVSGRLRDPLAALAAAALILLASAPLLLADVGFQLSFVATWALLYVAPVIHARLTRLPPAIRSLAAMTIAAQTTVMPLLAYHFMQISVTGYLANIAVVPMVGLLVPVGFVLAAAGALLPPVGSTAAIVLAPVLDAIAWLARAFAAMPLAVVVVPPLSLPSLAVASGALVVAVEWLRGTLRLRASHLLGAGICLIGLLFGGQVASALIPGRLTLTMLDVGQGDAILFRGPSGQTMLVDGGGEIEGRPTGYDIGARRVMPALRHLGVRRIDVVMLTHPHEDHVGGLVAVLQNFSVGIVLDVGLPHPGPSYVQFLRIIEARHIPYRLARRGMRLDLGDGMSLSILHPQEPLLQGTSSDANLNSIVGRLTYGRVSILLTGDAEAPIEAQLLDLGDDVQSLILKVGHHGSRTSTTQAFLDAVRPAVALISVGAINPFGHPDEEIIQRLEDAGAAVYRTDRHGAITLTTDGIRVSIRTVHDAGGR